MTITIRPEVPEDQQGIQQVHRHAFGGEGEARLVDLLRANGKALLSLVAMENGEVLGHILFSAVSLAGVSSEPVGMGLAPVAVVPQRQKQGIGSQLILAGLEQVKTLGCAYIVVLGDPAYYTRFGFTPASNFNLENEYGVEDEFMALELQPGALMGSRGLCQYASEFSEVGV